MGREFELKYRCGEDAFAALRAAYSGFTAISMATTYYDTPDARLSSRRWTLRQRYENGRSVCTLKAPEPTGGRSEWEVDADSILAAVPTLCKLGAPEALMALTAGGVEAVCGARFIRLALPLEVPGGVVELALDEGVLLGGGKELPLREVEVELKAGSDEAATAFAKSLAKVYGLVPETQSKYRRALGLARGER